MPDYSIRQILTIGIVIIIIINLIAVILIGGHVYSKSIEISGTLAETNKVLDDMKSTLNTLNNLPETLSSIDTKLGDIKDEQNITSSKLSDLTFIKRDIDNVNKILKNLSDQISSLEKKYQPIQNLYFNSSSEFQIEDIIDQSIQSRFIHLEKKINKFYWTLFGSLFGIGLISLGITLFKIHKRNEE